LDTKVALDLAKDLQHEDYVLVVDNLFLSVELFLELASREIYAMDTIRCNKIGYKVVQ